MGTHFSWLCHIAAQYPTNNGQMGYDHSLSLYYVLPTGYAESPKCFQERRKNRTATSEWYVQ